MEKGETEAEKYGYVKIYQFIQSKNYIFHLERVNKNKVDLNYSEIEINCEII